MSSLSTNRRRFLKSTASSAFAFTFLPGHVRGANERVRVASIGIGGKGAGDVRDVAAAGAEIVALCDVDDQPRRKGVRADFPKAPFYKDFRMMLEKEGDRIDAVTVSTPDHVHCHAAVTAMRMGKHVYCQKPLAHSVWEARLMAETAAEHGVATQMGNQAHAGKPIRRAVELIRAGLIGKVREVHTWTNRPIWPQGMAAYPAAQPIPNHIDWYLWLGPAPDRPYNEAYAPFKWRGWWDFGTGALGDMGCHIMDMPFWALELKHPLSVEAESEGGTAAAGPNSSKITYRFSGGPHHHDNLEFSWYDGGRMPSAEVLAGTGFDPQTAKKFDVLMIGDKGKFLFNRSSEKFVTTPEGLLEDVAETPVSLARVPNEDAEWIEACKGGPAALSNFGYSGPFTETVLLGNLALRLGRKVEWDGPALKATNIPEAESLIRRAYRKGWDI